MPVVDVLDSGDITRLLTRDEFCGRIRSCLKSSQEYNGVDVETNVIKDLSDDVLRYTKIAILTERAMNPPDVADSTKRALLHFAAMGDMEYDYAPTDVQPGKSPPYSCSVAELVATTKEPRSRIPWFVRSDKNIISDAPLFANELLVAVRQQPHGIMAEISQVCPGTFLEEEIPRVRESMKELRRAYVARVKESALYCTIDYDPAKNTWSNLDKLNEFRIEIREISKKEFP